MPGKTPGELLTRSGRHGLGWPELETLPRNDKGQLICGSEKKGGTGACENLAGYRTSHPGFGRCWRHYGNTPAQNKRAAKEATIVLAHGMGEPIDVDPAEAILSMVRRAAGNVSFYQSIIDSWTYPENEAMSLLVQLDGDMFEKSVVLKLYGEERDRLMQYCKIALQAGIAKQMVELAQQQATALNAVIAAILVKLGHNLGDPQVRQVVAGELVSARDRQLTSSAPAG